MRVTLEIETIRPLLFGVMYPGVYGAALHILPPWVNLPEPFQAGTPKPKWFDCMDDENIDRHHRREDWVTF